MRFSLSLKRYDNYVEQTKFELLWRVSIAFTIFLAVLTTIYIFDQSDGVYTYGFAMAMTGTGSAILYYTSNYRIVYLIYAIIGTAVVHFDFNYIMDSPHYGNFLWMLVAMIMTFIGLGVRWGIAFTVANVAGVAAYVWFSMDTHYSTLVDIPEVRRVRIIAELSAAIVIISYLISVFIKIQKTSESELSIANVELEQNNQIIGQRNEENVTLLKEIHHRVKNNLQIITSLLRLQQSEIENPEARHHFTEAINRVMVMSNIHQKLYQQKDLTNVDLEQYVTELAVELKQLYHGELNIEIDVDCDYRKIDLRTIVPVGLLLNELLSNSFKYAFDHKDDGKIRIIIQDKGDNFSINYSDDGDWKLEEADNVGFGLELIQILTEQLNGERKFETDQNGTVYHFELEKLDP